MLKTNELRTGNLLQDIIGLEKELVVYKIEPGIITCGDEDFTHPYLIETLKGIPIDADILKKYGFDESEEETSYGCWSKRTGYNDWDQDFFLQITTEPAPVDFCNIFSRDTPQSNCQIVNCPMYLHELQNLWFVITGEELNLPE